LRSEDQIAQHTRYNTNRWCQHK